MNGPIRRMAPVLAASLSVFTSATCTTSNLPLELEETIPLGKVEGRIDHLAWDAGRKRLYVAALGNNTVEVVDVEAKKKLLSLPGRHSPQGILYLSMADRIIVSDGSGDGCVQYDGKTLEIGSEVPIGRDCDNLRIDKKTGLIWVAFGDGALATFDPAAGQPSPGVELPGHPESFQLENYGPRLFANVPDAKAICVVDRLQAKLIATWPLTGAEQNYPMALDEKGHRLFVGCRAPPALLVVDVAKGEIIERVELSGDVDDLFLDPATNQVYATCGEGFVDVFDVLVERPVTRVVRIATATGARTGLFVPDDHRLFVAVPALDGHPAEIRIYTAKFESPAAQSSR